MIKCPNCGSTAQVKLEPTASLSRNQHYLTLGCECGCGCSFTVDYKTLNYVSKDIITIENKKEVIK